jgi:hypothetical protein
MDALLHYSMYRYRSIEISYFQTERSVREPFFKPVLALRCLPLTTISWHCPWDIATKSNSASIKILTVNRQHYLKIFRHPLKFYDVWTLYLLIARVEIKLVMWKATGGGIWYR